MLRQKVAASKSLLLTARRAIRTPLQSTTQLLLLGLKHKRVANCPTIQQLQQGRFLTMGKNNNGESSTAPPLPKNQNNHTKSSPRPTNSETVTVEENGRTNTYTAIREGKATILFPGGGEVFYNPIQNFNRDLSVLAIRCFGEVWLEERARRRKGQRGKGSGGGGGNVAGQQKLAKEGGLGAQKQEQAGEAAREELSGEKVEQEEGDNAMEAIEGGAEEKPTAATNSQPPQGKPVKQTQPNFRILDALSATGLRALRYSQEIPFATSLVANDLSASAVASIRRNINYNSPSNPEAIQKITVSTGNAMTHMYLNLHHYHVIDLDPYGTAAPFLDAALQAIVTKDSGPGSAGGGGGGGLLCVTCTDAGVWASTGYAEKCYALYGGQPLKGDCSHEGGLRLILYSIAATAAKYGLAIEPLLSLSIDFYARVFVRVKASPATVKHFASNSMTVYNCDSGCGAWTSIPLGRAEEQQRKQTLKGAPRTDTLWKYKQPQAPAFSGDCEHCGFRMHIAGPMWAGPLHDETYCKRLLDTVDKAEMEEPKGVYTTLPRVRGMVATALDECTFVKRGEEGRADLAIASQSEEPSATAAMETPQPAGEDAKANPPQAAQTSTECHEPSSVTPTPLIRAEPPYPRLPNPHFFLIPTRLSKTIHSVAPPQAQLRGALVSLGYYVGRSHCKPNSIKTDAPFIVIWEIMRQWVARYAPVKLGSLARSGPGWRVLYGEVPGSSPPPPRGKKPQQKGEEEEEEEDNDREEKEEEREVEPAEVGQGWKHVSAVVGEVSFDERLGAVEGRDRRSRSAVGEGGKNVMKEVRYQQNPTANWGPMKAAKGSALATAEVVTGSVGTQKPGRGGSVKRKGGEISEGEGEGVGVGVREGEAMMVDEVEGEAAAAGAGEKKIKLDN